MTDTKLVRIPAEPGALAAPLADGFGKNPVAAYLASLSKGSRRAQYGALKQLADMLAPGTAPEAFPWWQLTYVHTTALRSKLEERYATATANRHLAALRAVLQECFRLDLMSADACARARDLKAVKGSRLPKGRMLEGNELQRLLQACLKDKDTAYGKRDAALLVLLMHGLRRHEVVNATIAQYAPKTGALTVIGKGNKERLLFVSAFGQELLEEWLAVRPPPPEGPILTRTTSSAGLTAQMVYVVLRQRAAEAGLDAASFSAHDFRRTFISQAFEQGIDVSSIQQMVGHSNTSTTQRYDRRGDDTKKAASDKVWKGYGLSVKR